MSLQHLTPPYDKPEDFQHLYEEMHMSVFRYIYSLRSGAQQDVEDLTADTFSRAWKARRRFHGNPQAALGWLLQIARNLVIDQYRRTNAIPYPTTRKTGAFFKTRKRGNDGRALVKWGMQSGTIFVQNSLRHEQVHRQNAYWKLQDCLILVQW